MLLSLAGVLGLFFILVYAMKKLNSGLGYANGNKMKIIDRVSLGKEGMLAVVNVAGQLMLIGVSGQHIAKLADLGMTPEEYYAQRSSAEPQNGMSFASAFAEVIKRNKGAEKDKGNDKDSDKTEP